MDSIQTRGGRVFYSERGEGLPVVLLHANLHDHRDFDQVATPLSRRYRTIALDWPGHGRSELAPGRHLDAFLLAEVLEEVTQALDLPPAVYIGNSVGGFAAARLAINAPGRVAGLVLVNTGGFTSQNVVTRGFCRMMGTPAVTRRLLPLTVPSYMKARTDSDRAIAERVRTQAKTREGAAIAAGLWKSFAADEYDLRDSADRIKAPTLLVWGAKDTILPLKAGRQTAQAIPGARLESLETGHVVFSSDPDGFLELVEPFIEGVAHSGVRVAAPA